MQIALIGYGAIARYVADRLDEDGTPVSQVLCRDGRQDAARAALPGALEIATRPDALRSRPDLVLDCAGHEGLAAHGCDILGSGCDLITVSTGALADAGLADRLERAARAGGARLQLVSGAIGGLDALSAAAVGQLDRVSYTGRKPPAGWKGSPAEEVLDLDTLDAAACHFEGSAREAALRYPKNANVAASVALAGIGLDATTVALIADPEVTENIHEVTAEGEFGAFTFRIAGRARPENPRSSALTAMAVVRAVRARRAAVGF